MEGGAHLPVLDQRRAGGMAPPRQKAHPFVRTGLPILALSVGGFLILKAFVKGRHDVMVRCADRKSVV